MIENFKDDEFGDSLIMDQALQSATNALSRRYHEAIEHELVTRIEKIEGRVPTNHEVEQFGRKVIAFDHSVYYFTWRGKPLFSITPPRFEKDGDKTVVKWDIHEPAI